MIILSILIATTPDREGKFRQLYYELQNQICSLYLLHDSLGLVEIIVDPSKRYLDGGLSIGMKRNSLVEKANGKYLAFMDSDDLPAPNYVEKLLRMCSEDTDVCTFRAIIKTDHYWSLINMSLANEVNEEVNPESLIQRTPWHICAIKSEHAKKEKFNDSNHGEDWDWMKRIIPYLKSETHTDMILSQYNHSESGSEADKIIKSQQ